MGSGSQITKGVADIVLLEDEFSMLPRAVAEGRRIARNIHRLGRLYLTKTVYAAFLIPIAAIFGFTFPFLPRHLTVAALLTIGIPSFVLALAPSEGPLYRGRLLRALAAFAVPAGVAMRRSPRCSRSSSSTRLRRHARGGPDRGDDDADRARPLLHPAARARARAASTSRSRATCWRWSPGSARSSPLILAIPPVRDFFELELLTAGQWFLSLLVGRRRPAARRGRLAAALDPAARGARRGRRPSDGPAPTHRPQTGEQSPAVARAARAAGRRDRRDAADRTSR